MLVVGGNLDRRTRHRTSTSASRLGGDVVVGGAGATGTDLDAHGGRLDTGVADATAPYVDLAGQLATEVRDVRRLPATGTVEVTDDGDHPDRRRGLRPAGLHRRRRRARRARRRLGRSLQLLGVPTARPSS